MNRSRLFAFAAMLILGVAAGLVYGWVLQPSQVNNTSLDSLRADYKADYVLMVAETYNVSRDLAAAKSDLLKISPRDALEGVQQAIVDAQALGYSMTDLKLMANLETALKGGMPAQGATP